MHKLNVLICVMCVCFFAAFAQENTGKILGTVTDSSGAVVPEAKITATSPTLPTGVTTTSDSSGRYVLESVPIGTYTVTVTKEGLAPYAKPM